MCPEYGESTIRGSTLLCPEYEQSTMRGSTVLCFEYGESTMRYSPCNILCILGAGMNSFQFRYRISQKNHFTH